MAITPLIYNDVNLLGEIKLFALSISGAITKQNLIDKAWAICDGTTPASQGIDDAIITTTPDLQEKFIRMSKDETSGITGGSTSHTHTGTTDNDGIHTHTGTTEMPSASELARPANPAQQEDVASDFHTHTFTTASAGDHNHSFTTNSSENLPPFYELVYCIKVK